MQCNLLPKLLQRVQELFGGTLGTWRKYPLNFKPKEDAKPMCSRPYPVLKVHEVMFKNS